MLSTRVKRRIQTETARPTIAGILTGGSQHLPAMFLIAGNQHDEHDGTPEPGC